jgi:hypothetical protein
MHEDGADRVSPGGPETNLKGGLLARARRRLAYDPRWSNRKFLRSASQAVRNQMLAEQLYERENSKSRDDPSWNLVIPSDERVELPVLWVAELYSPSYAAGLTEALQSRSWPADSWGTLTGDNREDRLRRAREVNAFSSGRIGAFVDIGSKAQRLQGDAKREHLPEGIGRIEVWLVTIVPAVTAVVATCFLDKDGKDRLDHTLRADYQARLERPGGKIRIRTRRDEAVGAVLRERDRIHAEARQWLARKAPGIFAAEGDGRLPVLDVLLTHGYDPLVDSSSEDSDLRSALGLSHPASGRTVLADAPEFKLDENQTLREDIFRWTLCANYSAAFPDETFEHYWGQKRSAETIATILEANGWGRSLLIRLAISQLIDVKVRGMNRSRDLANRIHDGRSPVRSIKKLRRALLTNSIDLDAIATGIGEFTSGRRYERDVPRLRFEPSGSNTDEEDVLPGLARTQAESVKDLLEADHSMTARLEVVASLTSSLSGIRSQRWAAVLSVVAIAIAAAAGYISYLTLIASPVSTGH